MIQAQAEKAVAISPPQLVNNAAVVTTTVDTLGFNYAKITLFLGATDIALTALKVQESDDSGMSGAADIAGTVVGTDNNTGGSASVLPSSTDDNHFFSFYLDLRDRKRFLDLNATVGNGSTGAYLAAWAELSRAEIIPTTAAGRGNSQDFIV
jgi:hypothetical protein